MAAKEKSSSRLSAWLAPLLLLLAAVAVAVPASASMAGALETRAWEKTSAPLESRQLQSLQLLNLHQSKAIAGYNDALGSPLAAEDSPRQAGGDEPSQQQQDQGNGSYTNTHQSGKTYSGKGDGARANTSANNIANEHGDPLVSQDTSSAPNTNQSFIDEQNRIDANGGPGGNTYNKINSPGKKLRDGQ